MRYILFLSLPLYALDQWSKQLILRFIDPDQPRILVSGFFSLVNVTNTGAAFGSFRNNNTFFIAISLITLLIVVLFGHVIDFLLFDLHVPYAHPWPAFNVADSCISIAVVLFLIQSLWKEKHPAATGT